MKKLKSTLFALVFFGMASFTQVINAQDSTPAVEWEYKCVVTERGLSMKIIAKKNQEILNKLGKEGWELICMGETVLYLKRRIN